jgi:hypothetical protein
MRVLLPGRAFYRAEPSGGAQFNSNAKLLKARPRMRARARISRPCTPTHARALQVVRAVLVAGLYPQLVRAQSEPGKPAKFETRRFGEVGLGRSDRPAWRGAARRGTRHVAHRAPRCHTARHVLQCARDR